MSIHVLVTFLRAHLGGRRATFLQIGDMVVNASELPYSELDCSLGKGLGNRKFKASDRRRGM
jgi:hypothetical protein